MINYTMIFKDEEKRISYFYNLDDNIVYTDHRPVNHKSIKRMAYSGALVSFLFYSIISSNPTWEINLPCYMGVIIAMGSMAIGWIISLFIINRSKVFFIAENKQNMTNEEIKKMYIRGEKFRKNYRRLQSGLLFFIVVCTVCFCNVTINMFLLLSLIALWVMLGIMCFVNRPLCARRVKKIMKL